MNLDSKIFVAGHNGLVGSAVVRLLTQRGCSNIITAGRSELDLTDADETAEWFAAKRPEYVFLCAAKVGGIKANAEDPLGFFCENMAIQANVINLAHLVGVKKLLFLGSSCIYPKHCPQPIKEEYLLTGPIEPTTEPYALAKICGIRLCQWYRKVYGCNFVSAMPCNLFGPGDNFDPHTAHIVPGLMARMHAAKHYSMSKFDVWGDGSAKRELMYSDDLARALLLVMERYNDPEPVNTGSSEEYTVAQIAYAIAAVLEYEGEIKFDESQPVGTPRKILDNSKLRALGFSTEWGLSSALRFTYQDFLTGARRTKSLAAKCC